MKNTSVLKLTNLHRNFIINFYRCSDVNYVKLLCQILSIVNTRLGMTYLGKFYIEFRFKERVYQIKDITQEDYNTYLCIGSNCSICMEQCCISTQCSIFYEKRYCKNCALKNASLFPADFSMFQSLGQ